MTSRTGVRLLSALAAALAAAVVLAGCTGLPTSGPPNAGLAVGEEIEEPPFSFIADDPEPGAGPARIVEGFLDASMSPADSWKTARKFLTDDFQSTWKPDAGVTIDKSVEDRDYDSTVESDDEDATSAEVSVSLAQVASVDGTGAYSADTGTANATYRLVREKGGEWRIAEAPDGVTLDVETFSQVYEKFSLKYFDPTWTHLVPDVRWFPRRAAMATTVVRALISGEPSEWLAPAVRPFSSDVEMVGDAVTVDAAQVASVPLNRAALSASPTDLARMRTQLEASLQGAGVAEVRLLVDGVPLDAGRITVDDPIVDPGVLVLGDDM
ncbi:MAG: GerMN domain-containing protein, partial [Actinomycetota bacterium]|nr:GerMN domain-containing protein [Actinomycetota bacterium]